MYSHKNAVFTWLQSWYDKKDRKGGLLWYMQPYIYGRFV